MKRPHSIIAALAALMVCDAVSPSYARQMESTSLFTLTPATHVCVSALVSDDIPGPNHLASTDESHSKSLGAEVVWLLERRSSKYAHVIEKFHLIPETWPEECNPKARPILIDIRYSLNGRGRPFQVEWSVSQGPRRVERRVERDILDEMAAGASIGSTIDEPISEAIGDDKRARAAEIAALIE